MSRLSATQEQLRKVNKYKEKFAQAVSRYLNILLIHLRNDAIQEVAGFGPDGLMLPQRIHIHDELQEYAPLMHWTKQMEPKSYAALTGVFSEFYSMIYIT